MLLVSVGVSAQLSERGKDRGERIKHCHRVIKANRNQGCGNERDGGMTPVGGNLLVSSYFKRRRY